MKLRELIAALKESPTSFPRFVLPDGKCIPAYVHITEVGYVVKNFIDCGGLAGSTESVLLQTHVGTDTAHRLKSDRVAKILQLGNRVLPHSDLDVEVEYNCCVVAQYPIERLKLTRERLDIILGRKRTQCLAQERAKGESTDACCAAGRSCC